MTKEKSPNNIKASNLILTTAVLSIVNYLLVGPFTTLIIIIVIFGIALIVTLGILAQQGYSWFKWMYLGIFILELVNALQTIPLVANYPLIVRCLLGLHYMIERMQP